MAMLAAAPIAAASAVGLGVSVKVEKARIAKVDTAVRWSAPVKDGSVTEYVGHGFKGNSEYVLATVDGTLEEVAAAIRATTFSQGVKLGEIADAVIIPFAGSAGSKWFVSEDQLATAGGQPKATKVFGKNRVALGFSVSSSAFTVTITVAPADL